MENGKKKKSFNIFVQLLYFPTAEFRSLSDIGLFDMYSYIHNF